VTPKGLVKVMNRYLSTMSEPIRVHRGIIDISSSFFALASAAFESLNVFVAVVFIMQVP